MSGGERRRTEIARCLAIDPKFIMLDEPFAGVDPIAVEDIQQIVWKLKDKNIGILITDHNVQETLSITDRAYLLFEGKILFQGTPEELSENQIVREKYLSNSFVLRRKRFPVGKNKSTTKQYKISQRYIYKKRHGLSLYIFYIIETIRVFYLFLSNININRSTCQIPFLTHLIFEETFVWLFHILR